MRLKPNVVIHESVRNQSSRAGATPKLMVLHTTESHNRPGDADLAAIVSWFDNPAAQASSHVVVDAEGQSARCVPDEAKAWTQAAYNPVCLSIEQIGFSSQGSWEITELRETARWLAAWSIKHGIPLRRGRVLAGQVLRKGVVTHKQLGIAGGGHSDPGPDYPVKRVIALAKQIKESRRKYDRQAS